MGREGDSERRRTERDRQREQTRERLFTAALDIFRRDGVEAARIDDITQAAGVSRGAFYFHFPSKEDVLHALNLRSQLRIVARLAEVPDTAAVVEVLDAVADAMSAHWRDDPELLPAMGMVALKDTASELDAASRAHPAAMALIPRFERAVSRGELVGGIGPELLAQFFLVNLFGAALAWCGNPGVVDLQLLLRNVVRFFLRAAGPDDPGR